MQMLLIIVATAFISQYNLFLERHALHMVAYVDGHEVGRLVPTGLAGHVIIDEATVYLESLEGDVLYLTLLIIAVDDRHVGLLAAVADVAESDVLDTPPGGGAVLGVVAHLDVK